MRHILDDESITLLIAVHGTNAVHEMLERDEQRANECDQAGLYLATDELRDAVSNVREYLAR